LKTIRSGSIAMIKTSQKYPIVARVIRLAKKEAGSNLNDPAPPAVVAGPGVAVEVLAPSWYPGQETISSFLIIY
jgi:hypothetical protein